MSIYKKLLAVQKELKAPKNQFNNFGKYHYRNQEDILEAVKPLLEKNGLAMIIFDNIIEVGGRVYVKAEVHIHDIDDGTVFKTTACARESEIRKGMDDSQITGAASSYARKYALNGMFLIDDNKDADSNEPKKETKEVKPAGNYDKALEAISKASDKKTISTILSQIDDRTWQDGEKEKLLMFAQKKIDDFSVLDKVVETFDGEVIE